MRFLYIATVTLTSLYSALPPVVSANPWYDDEVQSCDFVFGLSIKPADCRKAFTQLPRGSKPVRWINNAPKEEPQGLPIKVQYGKNENADAVRMC